MSSKSYEIPGQEAMIVAAPVTSEMQTRDFMDTEPAVSLVEHHLQQIRVLNIFSTIHQKEWMLSHPDDVAQRYPKNHTKVLETTAEQRKQLEVEAKAEFLRSLGYYAVQDSGQVEDLRPYTKDAERRWTIFQARFRSLRKEGARVAEIDKLLNELKNFNSDRTAYNRQHGLRPHAPNKALVRRSIEDKRPVARVLTTRERLIAIRQDPRAGYLPAHNREKNTILSWLDYFDDPEHPLGIGNQLLEVLVSQQKRQTHLEGIRAVESITWEVGDYLADAANGYERLSQLQEDLEGILPSASLAEVEGLEQDAIAYLCRFEAVERLAKTGKHDSLKDVLAVKVDREVYGGSDPGKHKIVYSHFNAPEYSQFHPEEKIRPKETHDYIAERQSTLSVAQATRLLKRAIPNERIRMAVMIRCFADIHDSLTGEYDVLGKPIAEAINESLAAVADKPIVQLILHERTRQVA